MIRFVCCAALGYLLGSLSAAILISKYLFGQDVRLSGSGNAGATNAARVFGLGVGFMTFAFDFCKCLAALLLGRHIAGAGGLAAGGIACLLGHCFPVFFRFRGGKAVSCGAAVAVIVSGWLALAAAAVFLLTARLFRRASVSSMSAAVAMAALSPLFTREAPVLVLTVFTASLVVFMHRSNIRRLLSGTEPEFHPGKSPRRK